MPAVFVRNNNIDGAIKNFRNQLAKDGTLSKARDNAEGYKKPGVRNRLEKEANIRNCRKNNRNNSSKMSSNRKKSY
jgi:ribosomal protein S21